MCQIDPPPPAAGQWPDDSPNFDFDTDTANSTLGGLSVTDPSKPDTQLGVLSNAINLYQKNPTGIVGEDWRQPHLFAWASANLNMAGDNIAGDTPQQWHTINTRLLAAVQTFKDGLYNLDSSADPWKGATHDAAMQNVYASFHIPENAATGAEALNVLNDAFSRTLTTVRNEFVSNLPSYQTAIWDFPQSRDNIEQQYNNFARNVIQNVYNPNIIVIGKNNPGFNAGAPPAVGGANPFGDGAAPGGGGVPGGGGAPGGGAALGGGAPPGGGLGTPKVPNFADLANDPIGPNTPPPSQIPTGGSPSTAPPTSGLGDPSALASPLMGAAAPLQSLGQLANAAQQTGKPGVPGAPNGLSNLPREGALGLGPKGLKGGAGGIGGGAGARGAPIGKSAGAPSTGAGIAAGRTVAAGSRAGLGSATGGAVAGAPGAGAPAAGHQGAAQGPQYQPNKALQRKKNGEELFGDAEATVAVLGEPARPEAEKPEAT